MQSKTHRTVRRIQYEQTKNRRQTACFADPQPDGTGGMEKPMILIYPGNLQWDLSRLSGLLTGHTLKLLDDASKSQTMGELLNPDYKGIQNPETMHGEDEPFLYFSQVPVEEISQLQTRLEQEGIHIPAMAVETENNRSFTLGALMKEVQREAEYFKKREELADLISQADRSRMQSDQDYFRCVMMAAALLKEDELSENMLNTALKVMHSFE